MANNPSLPPDTGSEALTILEHEFYEQYGKALAAWASIEQSLSILFCELCGFEADDPLGPAIFFSGRSFQTRADLLAASIRVCELDETTRAMLTKLRNKARDYSKARNAIAHGYPVHAFFPDVEWEGWRIKEGEDSNRPGGIGIKELESVWYNFTWLDLAVSRATSALKNEVAGHPMPPAELLRLADGLPKDPFLPGHFQKEAERVLPPQSPEASQ